MWLISDVCPRGRSECHIYASCLPIIEEISLEGRPCIRVLQGNSVQTYLEAIANMVPDHHNKARITAKCVTGIFWFPTAYKSYIYTLV